MKIKLKFFALYRELVGTNETEKELKSGSKVKDLLKLLFKEYPKLKRYHDEIIVSVNKNYSSENTKLKDKDLSCRSSTRGDDISDSIDTPDSCIQRQ